MFGHSSGTIKYDINTGIKFQGTGADMKLTTGYNIKDNNYFIYITDRKTKITCRINMDAEYYKNFFAMGRYISKQHKPEDHIGQEDMDAVEMGLFP
jgi:hypothetical protein